MATRRRSIHAQLPAQRLALGFFCAYPALPMHTIRLINLLNSLRRLPPLSRLSGDEERMLFELRELWERKGALSVNDVYGLIASQSPSTSYRQLMALKKHDLVAVTVASADRRMRLVQFTRKAEELFRSFR